MLFWDSAIICTIVLYSMLCWIWRQEKTSVLRPIDSSVSRINYTTYNDQTQHKKFSLKQHILMSGKNV